MGGGLQVPSSPRLKLGIFSLSVRVLHEALLRLVLLNGNEIKDIVRKGEV